MLDIVPLGISYPSPKDDDPAFAPSLRRPQDRLHPGWMFARIILGRKKLVPQGNPLVQPKAKAALHEIWMAETRERAEEAFDRFTETYGAKYPKAVECLSKDRTELLAFYAFPAPHWVHLRTTNPVESTFATVRLRTAKTRNCLSRSGMLSMVFKLCQAAERNWRRPQGYQLLADVIRDVRFVNGIREDRIAA